MTDPMSAEALQFIVNHVVLPPKLPQTSEEPGAKKKEGVRALLRLVSETAKEMATALQSEHQHGWSVVERMLINFETVYSAGNSPATLQQALRQMKPNDIRTFIIEEQNCALFIQCTDEDLVFSCFEVSAPAKTVMDTSASLIWTFPGRSIAVPKSTVRSACFIDHLTTCLHQLTREPIEEMQITTRKAGNGVTQIRDTPRPAMISDMLMAFLAGYGKVVPVSSIKKRIRDERLYLDALQNWSRSPVWTVVKVSTQLACMHQFAAEHHMPYKTFMCLLLSKIVDLIVMKGRHRDDVYAATRKLVRRALKMGDSLHPTAQLKVEAVMLRSDAYMQKSWWKVQNRHCKMIPDGNWKFFENMTTLELKHCDEQIRSVLRRDVGELKRNTFDPHCEQRLRVVNGLPIVSFSRSNIELDLFDFEQWTAQLLPAREFSGSNGTIVWLLRLLDEYTQSAVDHYNKQPEQLSIMLLTAVEIWVAIDELAMKIWPILEEYEPPIAVAFLEPCLLNEKSQLMRLQAVEAYLIARLARATRGNVFERTSAQCLGVRYYEQSSHHHQLRAQIEAEAHRLWNEKQAEWSRLTAEFEGLIQRSAALDCTWYEFDDESEPVHQPDKCQKCQLLDHAKAMKIDRYEWPLPQHEDNLKAAVFELDVPLGLGAWRAASWSIAHDLGRENSTAGPPCEGTLHTFPGLVKYVIKRDHRIGFASKTKSFHRSHYRSTRFPVEVSSLLVNHGHQYELHDFKEGSGDGDVWTYQQTAQPDVSRYCRALLPRGPYEYLQYAVDGTSHTPNVAIATQNDSKGVDLHEHHAFASLRAGLNLQWLHISQALATPDLLLNKEVTAILIHQAASQAGPRHELSSLRQAHRILEDDRFAGELLTNVCRRFKSISENWQEGTTLVTLINLALRLRSLVLSDNLVERATGLLRKMRETALIWTRELNRLRQLGKSTSDIELRNHLLRAAFAAKVSFDGPNLLTSANEADVASLIEASIHLHDNSPVATADLPVDLKRLHYRDRRLSHYIEPVLRRIVLENSIGVSMGIKSYWDRLPQRSSWYPLKEPNQRWIESWVAASDGIHSTTVHLDLLTGELLVDGTPLGRLPKEITQHPLYRRVFGEFDPQIMRSEVPRLDHVTVAPSFGQYLYFSCRNKELIVQARSTEGIFELLPHTLFDQDLPASLVDRSTHWIDLQRKTIEVRPLDETLKVSGDNWKLSAVGEQWQARRHHEFLVGGKNSFHQDIISIMRPIEEARHIVVTASKDGLLTANLPRYNLQFFVNSAGELECREKRMVVDADQEIGTFIGLRNYLVLCNQGVASKTFKRQVIIPRGDVTIVSTGDHVEILIDRGLEASVSYCTATLDTILGRVQVDGISDSLYKTYLHAITASVRPDSLTGRSGTEEALDCLRSIHLLEPPSRDITGLLIAIQELSPKRSYYPEHLCCMQNILWHPYLSPHSQHEGFEVLVKKIYDNAERLRDFHGGPIGADHLQQRSQQSLIDRAAIRSSTFRLQCYGGEIITRECDVAYRPRDRSAWDQKSRDVFAVASLLHAWKLGSPIINLPTTLQKFGTVSGFHTDFSVFGRAPFSHLLHLPLPGHWGSIFNMCRTTVRQDSPRIAFILGILAFGGADVAHLKTLAMIAIATSFSKHEDFLENTFQLQDGTAPSSSFLGEISQLHNVPRLTKRQWRTPSMVLDHDQQLAIAQQQSADVHKHVMAQWPTQAPSLPSTNLYRLDKGALLNAVKLKFRLCYANKELIEYLERVQEMLERLVAVPTALPSLKSCSIERETPPLPNWRRPYPLFEPNEYALLNATVPASFKHEVASQCVSANAQTDELAELLKSIEHVDSAYAGDLSASLDSYLGSKVPVMPLKVPISLAALQRNHQAWKTFISQWLQHFAEGYRALVEPQLLSQAWSFGKRITVCEVLRNLNSFHGDEKDRDGTLLAFACAIASLQRCQRMIVLAEKQDVSNFIKEAQHGDERAWNVQRFPEWLALEIENDMAIRPVQALVGREMIAPSTGQSSTMQLNMGEGKSAVIVHMVAATLANKQNLCRLLILKPLMRQMMNILGKRHQGISRRPLYHIPFSRKTKMSYALLQKLQTLWNECRQSGGILLVQPEHMLSFKLMGIEQLSANPSLGRQIYEAYQRHRRMSRDILDESDAVLSTTFQLVYAIGTQKHLEGYPDRWTCQASLMDCIEKSLKSRPIEGLNAHALHDGSFPRMTFSKRSVGETFVRDLVPHLLASGAPSLTFDTLSDTARTTISRFLLDGSICQSDWELVENLFDRTSLRNLLLLRGLLAKGILIHCLQAKRWLVNYGLDLSRSMLAVPYSAKRVPSPRAEFGHPDVGILFTRLSYLYAGLNEKQLRDTFGMLYRSPDPAQQYMSWVARSANLPQALRDLRNVNLEDPLQFSQQLLPTLQYNRKTIEFYLDHVVFPCEAKEFSQKLSTSAWDIPAETHCPITTGFSGTNDNKSLLPRSICQRDLNELNGTNAMVLDYLLRPENRSCLDLRRIDGQPLELDDLIQMLLDQAQKPQVLIDVGALIIESSNEEVAASWLKLEPQMEAALFFDSDDEMIVIDRSGRKEAYDSSPYKDHLDKCLVYLDECHTRGTDLKLPQGARAVVTISPSVTKDRLVQACMRMRRLGDGQSLFFIINEQVLTSIVEISPHLQRSDVSSRDVVHFCLLRTCADNERLRPLWASYGINHRSRQLAGKEYDASTKIASDDKLLLEKTLETDARSLMEMYAPAVAQKGPDQAQFRQENAGDSLIQELQQVLERLPKTQVANSSFNEEQEREVDQEVQRMEEKQRPPNLVPREHRISDGLREYLCTGMISQTCSIMQAGESFRRTSFACASSTAIFSSSLCVTIDHVLTVNLSQMDASDYYLRPPTYVLTSDLDKRLVLISPFEADKLFWEIKASPHVSLRVYAPRSMKSMRGLDAVGLHTFGGPPSLAAQPWTIEQRRSLNLFAGQLYFESVEEYNALRALVAKLKEDPTEMEEDPSWLLNTLAAVRRKGKPFEATHLGKLINGRTLTEQEV